MSKYTKGPWEPIPKYPYSIWSPSTNTYIGGTTDLPKHVAGGRKAATVKRQENNARLMAAAPELLEALKRASEIIMKQNFGKAPVQIWDAIAKAEGEK